MTEPLVCACPRRPGGFNCRNTVTPGETVCVGCGEQPDCIDALVVEPTPAYGGCPRCAEPLVYKRWFLNRDGLWCPGCGDWCRPSLVSPLGEIGG